VIGSSFGTVGTLGKDEIDKKIFLLIFLIDKKKLEKKQRQKYQRKTDENSASRRFFLVEAEFSFVAGLN
jgi:hypothetical protein